MAKPRILEDIDQLYNKIAEVIDEILPNQLMNKNTYDADNDGIVDKADAANTATNASNLKKSDGTTVDADTITTKLSKVDDKIDKPSSAADGQVLTYNGTSNEWEAKNPSASITEPTDLEKGIIGGDAWIAKSYAAGSTVIYNNKIYSCIADCGASNPPTDTTYWEETSLSTLKSSLESVKVYETTFKEGTFTGSETVVSNTVNLPKGTYVIVGNLPAVVANAVSNFAVKVGNTVVAIIKASEEYKPFCGAITINESADLYLNGANSINVKLDYVQYGYIKAIKVK